MAGQSLPLPGSLRLKPKLVIGRLNLCLDLAQYVPGVTLAVRPFGEQPCVLRGNRFFGGKTSSCTDFLEGNEAAVELYGIKTTFDKELKMLGKTMISSRFLLSSKFN